MAVNTRFATGLHTLVILAAEPDALQTSEQIAEKLSTNPVVVRRVLSLLQAAGLIDSQKGPSGGSKLSRPAKKILLGEVYRAMEPASLFHVSEGTGGKVNVELAGIFTAAQKALERELDGTSLAQLAKKFSREHPAKEHPKDKK
jgi:Rrf2 family protein